jgi:hypothetical protein
MLVVVVVVVLLYYCKFTNVRVSFYYKHYCEMVRKKQHYPFASFLKQKHVMAFFDMWPPAHCRL